MERIRWVAAALCIVLLIQVVRAVRREHIRVEYSMAWFAAAVGLLGLIVWDRGMATLGEWLGLSDSVDVLLLLAGVAFLFTFFRFTVEVSSLKDHNIQVSQKVGLLEWEIRRQQEEIERLRKGSGNPAKDSLNEEASR